jgi:hypothetical protein
MTLAIFLPLVLAVVAIIDLLVFRWMSARGMVDDGKFNIMALVSFLLPVIAYIVLNFVAPEAGAIEIF